MPGFDMQTSRLLTGSLGDAATVPHHLQCQNGHFFPAKNFPAGIGLLILRPREERKEGEGTVKTWDIRMDG